MNDLTKKEKQTIAKVAVDLNISAEKIAEALGVHRATVYRYAEKPTDEEMRQFATEIETLIYVKRKLVLAHLLNNIQDLADSTPDIKGLAKAYEVLSVEQKQEENPQNIHNLSVEFVRGE